MINYSKIYNIYTYFRFGGDKERRQMNLQEKKISLGSEIMIRTMITSTYGNKGRKRHTDVKDLVAYLVIYLFLLNTNISVCLCVCLPETFDSHFNFPMKLDFLGSLLHSPEYFIQRCSSISFKKVRLYSTSLSLFSDLIWPIFFYYNLLPVP